MKKLLSLLCLLILLCSAGYAENAADDPLVLVKGIYDSHMYSEFFYDTQGRVTLEVTYQKHQVSNRYVYTYVDLPDGGVMAQIYNEMSKNSYRSIVYDAQGNCVETATYSKKNAASLEEVFIPENRRDYYAFTRDAEGRILTCTIYNRMSGETSIITYTYDAAGRLTSAERIVQDKGTVRYSYRYEYDGNGLLLRRYSGDQSTEFESRETRTWDNLPDSIWTQPNRYSIQYKYDDTTRKLLSVTIENTLDLLPAELYINDNQNLGLGEDNTIVLMPLSEAVKLQPEN